MSSALRRGRKRRKPTKRFDMSDMAASLEAMGFVRGDFSAMGLVAAAEDGGNHWELDNEDLLVEVEIMPSRDKIFCRVGTIAGGGGGGIWKVPPVGAEVHVSIPDGDRGFQPVISSWYAGGQLPEDISETVLVIAAPTGGNIHLHDGSGTVKKLAFHDELQALTDAFNSLVTAYNSHIHPGVTSGASSTLVTTSTGTSASSPVGTDTVKAK